MNLTLHDAVLWVEDDLFYNLTLSKVHYLLVQLLVRSEGCLGLGMCLELVFCGICSKCRDIQAIVLCRVFVVSKFANYMVHLLNLADATVLNLSLHLMCWSVLINVISFFFGKELLDLLKHTHWLVKTHYLFHDLLFSQLLCSPLCLSS